MSDETTRGEVREIVCPNEMAGGRLDRVVAELLPDQSRSFLKKILDNGGVVVDGNPAKASRKMRGGEAIRLFIPEPEPLAATPEDLPLDVLYEDDDLVVINKRPGMVAHPSLGHRDGTLVNALLYHYGDSLSGIGGVIRPGIVHRLDKDTSGCLVAAKNDQAHKNLIEQFMARDVLKTYLAITDGVPKPLSGKVEGQMGRSPKNRKMHALLKSGGRHSLTFYETLENYGTLALVRCDLKTGRTHQARVHLASLGAPVLCDRDYGRREMFTSRDLAVAVATYRTGRALEKYSEPLREILSRQALHAWKLSFRHPRGERTLSFEAPLSDDMLAVLTPLRMERDIMKRG